MDKTILIAPYEGVLAAALAERARDTGWSVVLAAAQKTTSNPQNPAPLPGTKVVAYEPRSCASVSALILSAANALGKEIEAAVIMSGAVTDKADFPAGRPADIAQLVDTHCAGPLYLARELVRRFEERGRGRILLFALENPRDAEAGPPAALVYGAFEGLGRGLFAASSGKTWNAYGLRDAGGQPDRAARFALELLEEGRPARAGRWIRFSGKSGLFG